MRSAIGRVLPDGALVRYDDLMWSTHVRFRSTMPKRLFSLWAGLALVLGGQAQAVTPTVIAKGLDHPWAVAFLPDGNFLVAERAGALRIVAGNGKVGVPLSGLPAIAVGGQGGLLDVVLDSDFANNRVLYFCFSEPARPGSGNSTALASARLSRDQAQLEAVRVLFSQRPKVSSELHFGCRIVESRNADGQPDGPVAPHLRRRRRRSGPLRPVPPLKLLDGGRAVAGVAVDRRIGEHLGHGGRVVDGERGEAQAVRP